MTRLPGEFEAFTLDRKAMSAKLRRAPEELSAALDALVLRLPMPDGSSHLSKDIYYAFSKLLELFF